MTAATHVKARLAAAHPASVAAEGSARIPGRDPADRARRHNACKGVSDPGPYRVMAAAPSRLATAAGTDPRSHGEARRPGQLWKGYLRNPGGAAGAAPPPGKRLLKRPIAPTPGIRLLSAGATPGMAFATEPTALRMCRRCRKGVPPGYPIHRRPPPRNRHTRKDGPAPGVTPLFDCLARSLFFPLFDSLVRYLRCPLFVMYFGFRSNCRIAPPDTTHSLPHSIQSPVAAKEAAVTLAAGR